MVNCIRQAPAGTVVKFEKQIISTNKANISFVLCPLSNRHAGLGLLR